MNTNRIKEKTDRSQKEDSYIVNYSSGIFKPNTKVITTFKIIQRSTFVPERDHPKNEIKLQIVNNPIQTKVSNIHIEKEKEKPAGNNFNRKESGAKNNFNSSISVIDKVDYSKSDFSKVIYDTNLNFENEVFFRTVNKKNFKTMKSLENVSSLNDEETPISIKNQIEHHSSKFISPPPKGYENYFYGRHYIKNGLFE